MLESQFTAISLKTVATQLRGRFLLVTLSFLVRSLPSHPSAWLRPLYLFACLYSGVLCGHLTYAHLSLVLGTFLLEFCLSSWNCFVSLGHSGIFLCMCHMLVFCGIFWLKPWVRSRLSSVFLCGLFVPSRSLLLTVTSMRATVAGLQWPRAPVSHLCLCAFSP